MGLSPGADAEFLSLHPHRHCQCKVAFARVLPSLYGNALATTYRMRIHHSRIRMYALNAMHDRMRSPAIEHHHVSGLQEHTMSSNIKVCAEAKLCVQAHQGRLTTDGGR